MDRKKIAIVILSDEVLMDFAGPADVFRYADKLRGIYDVVLISPDAYPTKLHSNIDTLLIAGNDTEAKHEAFYTWLAGTHSSIRRIGTINVGVAVLERSGLVLDHNFFHTRDGQLYTSGGVSSGIDLALAMVEEDCGRGVAADVARRMIFFYLNKSTYQVQFGHKVPASPLATELKDILIGRLHEPLDVGRLAEKVNMSSRNFTRVFGRQTGISPAKFIEKLRVEAARIELEENDRPLEEIALRYGLGGLVSMRRLFLRHMSVTPSDYRKFIKLQKYENCN